jgi:hypothetical protein
MNNSYRTSEKFGVAWNDVKPNQFAWPRELEFGDFRSATPGFELMLETPSVLSGPAERYVNTSTWKINPLRSHGGTGANVLLRWNNVPADARAIDVVVHLHGFIGQSNEEMLRTVAGYSGLNLSGRVRPTLGILPRGRLITPDEVRQTQARLDELARKSGKKPAKARSDVQTFPGLLSAGGAGLEALITGALQWFAQQRGGGAPLTIARLILTAHSGGGGALDRLVASHARRRVCNPDEVHAFDALYSEAGGLKSWVTARLGVDRSRQSSQLDSLGGALRVFYRPHTGTQPWSERVGRSLPPASDPLSRFYRIDCSRLSHFEIPKQFGPLLLRDRTADLSSFGPCATGARSTPAATTAGTSSKQASTGSAQGSGSSVSPARAPLPTDVRAWIRSIDRSAIELVADEAQRRRFLQEIDWSREYFPGNPDAQSRRAPGRLAEELFNTMARVTPERRVPRGIRYHDVTGVVASVPGQSDQKLFPEARDAFVRMRDAAAADGVRLEIISSWRSVARQQAARSRQANPNAVAPGISAHNYGLAIDLNMRVPGLSLVNISTRARDRMANMVRMYRSPNYKWLALHGSRFGWFPYKREPWHWEYNPPGFKERFEGNTRSGTASELGATERVRSYAGPLLSFDEFGEESILPEWGEQEFGLESESGPCPDVPVPASKRRLLVKGSLHSTVREAQRKLNAFHRYRLAAGLSGLRDSPLAEDCDFRTHTFEAVKSFQELVFPGMPVEHDGKIGPHTWAQLDAVVVGPGLSPSAQLAIDQLRITDDGFTGALTWDQVIGLNTVSLNVELVAFGLPPAVMPPQIMIEISSRAPNRAGGTATLVTALKLPAARFGPESANPNRIIYRLSKPLANLGEFLKVERQIKEVATIVRSGGTSDAEFRRALGWNSRGIGTQPSTVGASTGSESSEIPDAFTLFRSAGVEVLELKVPAQPNWVVPGSVKRLVRSPADVVYYSGHGLSSSGKLALDIENKPCGEHGSYSDWLGPADLSPVWTSPMDLDVLILAGCSVLKIDFSTSPPSGPGVGWSSLLRAKGGPLVALVGYQRGAPCDSPNGDRIAKQMAQRMTKGSISFARDWLTVNGDNNANNAVAMDDRGYWWIETTFGRYDIKGPKPIP